MQFNKSVGSPRKTCNNTCTLNTASYIAHKTGIVYSRQGKKHLHTEIYFPNLVKSHPNQIVFTIFRFMSLNHVNSTDN